MEQLTTNNGIMAGDLQHDLFTEFVEYIDRGEKTTRTYIVNLRQFVAWLRFTGTSRPTRQDIILYRQYLTEEHDAIMLDASSSEGWTYRTDASGHPVKVICKPNTVKQYLQSVRQFFSWTAANGYYPNIAANIHAPKVRQDAHKKEALTATDVLAIEQSIDTTTEQGKRLLAMYLLAVNAGLRTIELSRANIKDIEVKHGNACLYIWGKGHAEADTKKPLAPQVYDAIRDYINSRTDRPTKESPLFVATGNRSGGKRLATTTISTMLKRAMQAAGYDSERLTAHSLRHTAGTNAQEITGNLYLTQQYMRHASPTTTEIYLHVDTERQEADIAQALYDRYHQTAQEDDRATIDSLLKGMTAEQLRTLVTIAQAAAVRA